MTMMYVFYVLMMLAIFYSMITMLNDSQSKEELKSLFANEETFNKVVSKKVWVSLSLIIAIFWPIPMAIIFAEYIISPAFKLIINKLKKTPDKEN